MNNLPERGVQCIMLLRLIDGHVGGTVLRSDGKCMRAVLYLPSTSPIR